MPVIWNKRRTKLSYEHYIFHAIYNLITEHSCNANAIFHDSITDFNNKIQGISIALDQRKLHKSGIFGASQNLINLLNNINDE